jgi:hypothetical protein
MLKLPQFFIPVESGGWIESDANISFEGVETENIPR